MFVDIFFDKLHLDNLDDRDQVDLTLARLFTNGHHTLKFAIHHVTKRVRETTRRRCLQLTLALG